MQLCIWEGKRSIISNEMSSYNLLRKQVLSEVKKKRLIFLTFVTLSFLYLSISLIFGDMGLFRYIELNRTKKNLEKEITEINHQNEQLRTQLKLLKEDAFYREKLAREEYGLSKPNEYIFQYEQ
jgi:cell division protein FtsB